MSIKYDIQVFMFRKMIGKTENLLRKSEKYTKTDMVYAAKGGFWLFLGQIVAFLGSIALLTAFANLVSPEVYGQYKFMISGMGIVGSFFMTGLNNAVTQSVSRGYLRSLVDAFKIHLSFAFIPILISLGVSFYYYTKGESLLSLAFLFMAIILPLMRATSLFEPFLVGTRNFRKKLLLMWLIISLVLS